MTRIAPEMIRRSARLLLAPGQTTELRAFDALKPGTRDYRVSVSGYYTDHEALVRDAATIDAEAVYIMPNPILPGLLARAENRLRWKLKSGDTTSDDHILRRRWLLVDVDATEAHKLKITATDGEHDAALSLARTISHDLQEEGWTRPILADSGNGAHLLFHVDLPNDDDARKLMSRCLNALSFRFSNDVVDVDTSTFNAARIWKLYGTMARKGDPIPERPHRMACLVDVPDAIEVVRLDLLEELARSAPEEPRGSTTPRSATSTRGDFRLGDWIAEHLDDAKGPITWDKGDKWILPVCPFNAEHSPNKAWVLRFTSGAIAAGCRHNSCTWGWHDLRGKYEPQAQERREAWEAQNRTGCDAPLPPTPDDYMPDDLDVEVGVKADAAEWPPFQDLPSIIPTVPHLSPHLLPLALRAWLEDVAERKSLHLEMVAIPALVTLGSVAGRLVAIRPEPFDDWEVVPNLWGAVVARPGMMKTAALSVGTDPLKPLIAKAYDEYSEAREPAEAKIRALQSEIKQMSRAAEKAKDPTPIDRDRMTEALREIEQSAVRPKRYMAKDATVEMLAELISENPRGLLVVRDELSAWLGNLAKPGRDGDRGFYLEAWDGNGSHVVDRIGRGTTHIPALCLGVLGTIQPGLMSKLVSGADAHGDKDDGLVQRFQLFVWPDALRDYKEPTRRPNVHAKSKAYEVYQWAAAATAPMLNACVPESRSRMPFVGFDSAAQELWKEWRREFEARIRDAEVQSFPSYASHIAKYRSMVPSIALLDHLADLAGGGTRSDVGRPSLERAIRWAEYLDAHARKLYGVASPALVAAHRLAARVTEGSIESRMTVRKVKRKDWSGLTSDEDVYGGLNVLESLGWLRVVKMKTGGAPSYVIELRPDHEAALDDLTAKTDKSPDTASEPDLSSVLSVPSESSTPESASPQISETWECIT